MGPAIRTHRKDVASRSSQKTPARSGIPAVSTDGLRGWDVQSCLRMRSRRLRYRCAAPAELDRRRSTLREQG